MLLSAEGDWEKTANTLREIVPVGDGDDAVGEKNEEGVEEKEKFIVSSDAIEGVILLSKS